MNEYDAIAIMRAVEASFYYGETVAQMIDKAADWIMEGEEEIGANIMVAAAYRVDLFIQYGV